MYKIYEKDVDICHIERVRDLLDFVQYHRLHRNFCNLRKRMPYMTEIWYPDAVKDPFQDSGAHYTNYAWRGVLHTTEGDSYAAARSAYAAGVAPHFTVSFETGKFQVWQHIPLNKGARALKHIYRNPIETNRARCIQFEIVAHADSAPSLPGEYLDGIGRLMRWVEGNTEIKPTAPVFHGAGEGIVLATVNSPIRFTDDQWTSFNGWCGHQHVPQNDHWDPGAIDIAHLLKHDITVVPMFDPAVPILMAAHCRDPESNGGWIVQPDGAVFSIGNALFHGGVNNQPFFAGETAALIQPGADFTEEPWKLYKYVITAVSGHMFGRP